MEITKEIMVREDVLEKVIKRFDKIHNKNYGLFTVLKGESGSGRTSTLKAIGRYIRREYKNIKVVGGSFTNSGYEWWGITDLNMVGTISEVTDIIGTFPGLPNLYTAFLKTGCLGLEKYSEYKKQKLNTSQAKLLEFIDTIAKKNHLVLILDDINLASKDWLTFLLLTLPFHINTDLPLTIIGSIESNCEKESIFANTLDLLSMQKQIEIEVIQSFEKKELSQLFLDTVENELIEMLFTFCNGKPGLLFDSFELLKKYKIILKENGIWKIRSDISGNNALCIDFLFNNSFNSCTEKEIVTIKQFLYHASLEGKEFSLNAVSEVMNININELRSIIEKNLIDDLNTGIITYIGTIKINHLEGVKSLERYKFNSNCLFILCKKYGLKGEYKLRISNQYIEILKKLYYPEVHIISNTLSKIFFEIGNRNMGWEYKCMSEMPNTIDGVKAVAKFFRNNNIGSLSNFEFHYVNKMMIDCIMKLLNNINVQEILLICEDLYQITLKTSDISSQVNSSSLCAFLCTKNNDIIKAKYYLIETIKVLRKNKDLYTEKAMANYVSSEISALEGNVKKYQSKVSRVARCIKKSKSADDKLILLLASKLAARLGAPDLAMSFIKTIQNITGTKILSLREKVLFAKGRLKLGDVEESKKICTDIINLTSNQKEPYHRAQAFELLGEIFEQENNFSLAINALNEALSLYESLGYYNESKIVKELIKGIENRGII